VRPIPTGQVAVVMVAAGRLGIAALATRARPVSSIAAVCGSAPRPSTWTSNAERRALFVGLWPPMIWMIGDSLAPHEALGGGHRRRLRP
jgi:hypothetical protein